ncbi:MAG: FkbM family methyltransferase [Pseudomonadota bacterium]
MAPPVLIEQQHIRLRQCRHGAMLYHSTDRYIGRSFDRYGEFSEGEIDLFRQVVKPGQVVLDIGANIGAHTVVLARATGPRGLVVAVEPQRLVFQMLCANLALNGLTNVRAHWAAVGRAAGRILVPRLDYAKPGNFGGLALGGSGKGEPVPVVPIDALNLPACHFIKVDVEGMEGEAIAGARATIERFRPILYVENDRREKSAALIAQLLELGYRLYWHLPPLFNPRNFFGESENLFANIVSVNMLCISRSVDQTLKGLQEITSPDSDWRSLSAPPAWPRRASGGCA